MRCERGVAQLGLERWHGVPEAAGSSPVAPISIAPGQHSESRPNRAIAAEEPNAFD